MAGEEEMRHSWHWWLGRVNFLDQVISRFSCEFLLQNCTSDPSFSSDTDSNGGSSITLLDSLASIPESQVGTEPGQEESGVEPSLNVENSLGSLDLPQCSSPVSPAPTQGNLLVRAWYFAAKATHVPHNKLGKVSRRVIVRLAKVLRDDPSSLEVVHDVVSKCHRTQAEGLLDRVFRVREKSHSLEEIKSLEASPMSPAEREGEPQRGRVGPRRVLSVGQQLPSAEQDVESSIVPLTVSRLRLSASSPSSSVERGPNVPSTIAEDENELVHSDDSYRSAVSDLEEGGGGERRRHESGGEASPSTSNSYDSKSGESRQVKSSLGEGSVASGGSDPPKYPRYYNYKRQSTVDSTFSDSSLEAPSVGYYCKKNIEEEEAEAEARVRSMLPEDPPHPLLSGMDPPTPEVLLHIQRKQKEGEEEEEVSVCVPTCVCVLQN